MAAHLVAGKAFYWNCCRKSSQFEVDTGVHAVAVVDRHGMHGVAAVEDSHAWVANLRAAGKEVESCSFVVSCSLDGCTVAVHADHDRGHSHILGPGGSHCRRDLVDTFPALSLCSYIPSVGFFLC